MQKRQKQVIVVVLMLMFATVFIRNTRHDFPLIFEKDLHAHDESSNSVVAANITRKFFPPMVRVNPLNTEQGNWMEGPFWQHIPPLFAYVPYLFFKLDGSITIEMKRLSFAFLTLLTGLLFIFSVYKFRKSLWATGAATLAAILWVNTPFTHELITGYAFGVSDIVLAFTVTASFGAILWYLEHESETRVNYPWQKLATIGLVVALPIIAKNLLGAIPAATFFTLLLRDQIYRIDEVARYKKVIAPFAAFLAILGAYLLPLYLSSPVTFKNEILVSFAHFKSLEGWERPRYWYVTNYLPQRYLFGWTWIYYGGLIFGFGVWNFVSRFGDRKDKILLAMTGGWFAWNLIAISLVTSKVPNFIYQTYLLSWFFIIYSLILVVLKVTTPDLIRGPLQKIKSKSLLIGMLVIAIIITGWQSVRFVQAFHAQRAQAYNYQTEHEKFYQLAENLRLQGLNTNDLVVAHTNDDCWLRYYILFLTGTESKTLLEMYFNTLLLTKYERIFFVDKDLSVTEVDSKILTQIIDAGKLELESEIQTIKKDKTSCQWLVPDPILNAP